MMQTERLEVTGMSCGGCTRKVIDALEAVPGVGGVDVSLAGHEATVSFDTKLTSLDRLESAVRDVGYGVGGASSPTHTSQMVCCCG